MAEPDLIGIVVQDMGVALRFYRTLGLEIPPEADSEPHVEYTTPGGFRIAWDTFELMRNLYEDWGEPSGHRTVLAFKCESPTEVDALFDAVVQQDYRSHKEPWDAFWGQRYAVVVDPDGNLVDLFANLHD